MAFASYTWSAIQEASNLLGQVHSQVQHVKGDAATLESFNGSNLGWRSHAHALDEIRDGIGSMGGLLARLLRIRDQVLPWQQQAIDRISPALEDLATRTGRQSCTLKHTTIVFSFQTTKSTIAQSRRRPATCMNHGEPTWHAPKVSRG